MIDLAALLIFKTVAEQGGINKAAQKLHRVPSNVTTRVKQLEQDLGTKLFTRQGRGLAISPEGSLLLLYADRLFKVSAEAEAALKKAKPRGTLRIGTLESIAMTTTYLQPVLSRFHRAYPDVQVELSTGPQRSLVSRLRQGDIEAAFVPQPMNARNLEMQPAFFEELVLITPRGFPRIRSPKDIRNLKVTAFVSGCLYEKRLEEWLKKGDVKLDTVTEYQSFDSILGFVAQGAGIAMVPRSVVRMAQAQKNVAINPLPRNIAQASTQLVWRAGQQSASLEALKAIVAASPGKKAA